MSQNTESIDYTTTGAKSEIRKSTNCFWQQKISLMLDSKTKKGDLDDATFVLYLTIGISVIEVVKATSLKDGQQRYGIQIYILKKAAFFFFYSALFAEAKPCILVNITTI